MENGRHLFVLLSISFFILTPIHAAKQSYIVYLGEHTHDLHADLETTQRNVENSHYSLLGSFLGSEEKARNAIFYSYTHSINGFAAVLDDKEADEIKKHPSVLSVFLDRKRELHTTRSWEFMGLAKDGKIVADSAWTKSNFGEGVIIANIDTGVWPESESFRDDNLGPIPSRWKGICQNEHDKSFQCNRKLIGARYFNKAYLSNILSNGPLPAYVYSPRDTKAHGSHTLSTAGGAFVLGANVFGQANGTASGGSPRAHVATYKACYGDNCYDADILAGFDAAIHDGVDVLSVSIGGEPSYFYPSSMSVGSFHAVKNNITVVASAGNSGPKVGTVDNYAPWILTVAASTIDRKLTSYLSLGDKQQLKGESVSRTKLQAGKLYPLITAFSAEKAETDLNGYCIEGTLDPVRTKGKIVVCSRGMTESVYKGIEVRQAGGIGVVVVNREKDGDLIIADLQVLPAVAISYSDGQKLFSYFDSTKTPVAYISYPSTELGTKPAPYVADFSSVGPSIYPEFLKPDITAPGVNIIAAYSEDVNSQFDGRITPYSIMSGTSMACPHVAGVVGLVKSLHPTWSPSAIKSAIMTTARSRDNLREPITKGSFVKATPFDYGFGHLRPNRAVDPGLVYDLTTTDHLNYICASGLNITDFQDEKFPCPSKPLRVEDLNYPSITVPHLKGEITVTRTLKNVGRPGTYKVRVDSPSTTTVSVKPTSLTFEKEGEEKKFEVTIKAKENNVPHVYTFGRLIWSDGKHYVRSPIVVKSGSLDV